MRNDRILQTTVKNKQQEMKLPPQKRKADSWQWSRKSRKTGKPGTGKSIAGAVLAVEGLMLLNSKKADALSKEEMFCKEKQEVSVNTEIAATATMCLIFAAAFIFSRVIGRYFGDHHGWGVRKNSVESQEHSKKEEHKHSEN